MKHLLFILFLVWANFTYSQQIGQIKLIELTSDKELTISSILKSGHSVVIFNSIECPYDQYYIKRLQKLAQDTRFKEVKFIFVNPTGREAVGDIKSHFSKFNLEIEYYLDSKQTLFKALGATKTPEVSFFLLRNGIAEVIYKGAIDNNPQMAEAVSEYYLAQAIKASLNGQKIKKNFVRPMGCVVKNN